MAASFEIDAKEFDATLNKYFQIRLPRDVVRLLNSKARAFISGRRVNGQTNAIAGVLPTTKAALKSSIKADLASVRFYDNLGDEPKDGTYAIAIVQSRRKKKGQLLYTQALARREGNKMIRARVRSIGHLRSGWLHALKDIVEATGKTFRKKLVGRPKGKASAARLGKQEVWMQNEVKPAQNLPDPKRAMSTAFKAHSNDMKVYIENRLRPGMDEIKGKKTR